MAQDILSLTAFKTRFDPVFSGIFDAYLSRASSFARDEETLALLTHAKTIALSGGKRIRPYVGYLAFRTSREDDDVPLFPVLAALELFHTFALIHDDIIDQGSLRHGMPTLHAFAARVISSKPASDKRKAEGLAMLIGDLIFSWSKDLFARETLMHGHEAAHEIFNDMAYAAVLGQILDVQLSGEKNPTEERVLRKTLLKTAQYTFIYPMRIGSAIAGGEAAHDGWCDDFGTALGLAFQLQDDLLDIVGDQRLTGKKSLQDAIDGQHTVFTAYVRHHASKEDVALLDTILRQSDEAPESEALQALLKKTGALAYGQSMIKKALVDARAALAARPMPQAARDAWESLIAVIERRAS